MIRNAFLFCLTALLILSTSLLAEKVATFTDMIAPSEFHVDADRFYISEGASISIYSLKDYTLIKKFGKEGEGPGEILLRRSGGNNQIMLAVRKDHIIVKTGTKILFFTKNGDFVKEIKVPASSGRWLEPLKDIYVARKYVRKDTANLFHAVHIFDSQFNLKKELYSHRHGLNLRKLEPFNPLTVEPADFEICGDRIFVIGGNRVEIIGFNVKGEKLFTLTNT
ncbi:MAG: hypothetical protein GY757_00580, partial [bacterium]|nr:hypothetical protein [bacterium]